MRESDNATCCCNCKYRLKLLGSFESGDFPQIGLVCVVFAFEGIAYKGDFEHGSCELFTRSEVVPHGT